MNLRCKKTYDEKTSEKIKIEINIMRRNKKQKKTHIQYNIKYFLIVIMLSHNFQRRKYTNHAYIHINIMLCVSIVYMLKHSHIFKFSKSASQTRVQSNNKESTHTYSKHGDEE
jgi:hypothetical protein